MDPDGSPYLMYVLCFMLFAFFCVLWDAALRSLNKRNFPKMNGEEAVCESNSRVVFVRKVMEDPVDIFNTLLFGKLVAYFGAISLGTVLALKHWGEGWGLVLVLVLLIAAVLVLVRIIPEVLGKKYAMQISCASIKIVVFLKYLLYPLVKPFDLLRKFFNKKLGIEHVQVEQNEFTEEEIINMVATGLACSGQDEEEIKQVEKTMLHGVIEFADMVVNEVMTPRPDIVMMEKDSSYDDLLKILKDEQFSRIPVYEETVDNIIGVVHIKDLILLLPEERENFYLEKHVRQTIFVPETKKISELFMVMKKEKIHMAIVLDEYGSTAGIVTLEDLIEEIMGDIQDEHDREEPLLRHLDDDTVEINASMRIDELNESLDLELSCEEADTVGGLVFATLDRIPVEGDKVELDDLELSVLEMEGHRIEKVRLNKVTKEEEAAEA